jgi:hypothetical protein
MPIAIMIQLAIQAASGAIGLLQQLGYLKPKEGEQMMQTLMNGQVPPEDKT